MEPCRMFIEASFPGCEEVLYDQVKSDPESKAGEVFPRWDAHLGNLAGERWLWGGSGSGSKCFTGFKFKEVADELKKGLAALPEAQIP